MKLRLDGIQWHYYRDVTNTTGTNRLTSDAECPTSRPPFV